MWIAHFQSSFVGVEESVSESSVKKKIDAALEDLEALNVTVRGVYYNLRMIAFDATDAQLQAVRETWQVRLDYLTPNKLASSLSPVRVPKAKKCLFFVSLFLRARKPPPIHPSILSRDSAHKLVWDRDFGGSIASIKHRFR